MTLGRYPGLSLSLARQRALEKLALAADGTDPKAERAERVRVRVMTVEAAADAYLSWCASNNAPSTLYSKRSALSVHVLPALGVKPLVEVRRSMIAALLDSLGDQPATRRQLYLYLSHFFGWCVEREMVTANPAAGLKPPRPVPSRERVLSDSEIADLFKQDGVMAIVAKLCLLTAQRCGSVQAMRWDALDLQHGVWTISGADMKSGKLHVVLLSPLAISLIAAWPRLSGPYLFGVGSDGARPYTGASNGMGSLRARLGGEADWRLHDLRRTAVTLAQRAGCSLDPIRALTQHKSAGVIGIYARHGFETEKRAVVEAIATEVSVICEANDLNGMSMA